MDPASANPDWWIDWLVLGPLVLLWVLLLPTYVGGLVLRLSVAFHNASGGPATAVPMPGRGKAMGIVFLATLFNVLVTWSYITSFSQAPTAPGSRMGRGFDDEQEGIDGPAETPLQQAVSRAILLLRAFLLGLAILILARILLPTTPPWAFLITGNYWLIGTSMVAVVFFLVGIEQVLPKGR
jgi:hypothetical protein